MSITLLPCDGVDFSLLVRAAAAASATSMRQLDHERLKALAAKEGINFATAVLYDRTKRDHAACATRIDQVYRTGCSDKMFQNVAFVYVPNLAYFADPKSQRVGATICQVAEGLGCRSYVAPTSATLDLRANARIVCESLANCSEPRIVVASVSKGSADVKMALRDSDSRQVFHRVTAWIDVCGLSDGSPLVNLLANGANEKLYSMIENWFRSLGASYVHEVVEAARELGWGPEYPLSGREPLPSHIARLNVVGFPTARHFKFVGSQAFHRALAHYGPNDGYGLLRDMVAQSGSIYPIWGTDHYFEAHLDVARLAAALLRYLAKHIVEVQIPAPKVPSPSTAAFPNANGSGPARDRVDSRAIPRGQLRNEDDWARLRHSRARHDGFAVGRYLQPAPMIYTRDGHNVFLGDMYRGRSAFLVAGGPSLISHDLNLLSQRGILTCAVNNAAAVYRPHLWVSVDDPGNFVDSIWRDAGILKFVPLCHMEKHFVVRNEHEELVESEEVVGDMPGVFGYRRNERFREEQWLYEDTFNWGNHSKHRDAEGNKGSRSVMYVAIRLMFYLGVRRLYLLGCDFKMNQDSQNYAFPQNRTASSVRGNNESYHILNRRLSRLKPYFDREGFDILNCTPSSGLEVFPHISFEAAIQEATADLPRKINTADMYDRQKRERTKQDDTVEAQSIRVELSDRVMHPACKTSVELPEMSLVVAVNAKRLARLAISWPTWMRHRPELASMPLIVIHDQSVDASSPQCAFLREHSQCSFELWTAPRNTYAKQWMHMALVAVPAQKVQTPWYIALDVDVIATPGKPWFDPNMFAPDETGRSPVYVGHRLDCSKGTDAIEALGRWADSVPALLAFPSVDLQQASGLHRMRQALISSWCVVANTAWNKEAASYVTEDLPCPSHTTFLSYCAARRGEITLSVDLTQYGWKHVRGSERRLRRCSNEVATL